MKEKELSNPDDKTKKEMKEEIEKQKKRISSNLKSDRSSSKMDDEEDLDEKLKKFHEKEKEVIKTQWQMPFPWDEKIMTANKLIMGFDSFREN